MPIEVLTFYHPLPRFGVKLNNQWDEFREDFDALAPLVRAAFMDIASSSGSHDLAGLAVGELDFRNRYRIFYDKSATEWKIQFNSGTEAVPVWTDYVRIRNTDGRFIVEAPGGLESANGFYNIDFLTVGTAGVTGGFTKSNITRFNVNSGDGFYWTVNNQGNPVLNQARAAGTGEANTASNLGGGEGVFASKVGEDLRFKSLVGGTGVTLSSDASEITIDSSGGGSGFYGVTVAQSDGNGTFSGINKINFESASFYVTQNAPNTDEVQVNFRGTAGGGGSGESNTASNRGGDEGIFFQKTGVDLEFKGLTAGSNVTLSSTDDAITINSSGGGGGFYGVIFKDSDDGKVLRNDTLIFNRENFYLTETSIGKPLVNLIGVPGPEGPTGPAGPAGAGFYGITLKHSDDTASFSGINVINVEAENFYLTQNDPNTDEVQLNFRGTAASSFSLTVRESDGSPNVSDVDDIIVSNGTLTDNGGGTVTITTGGGGGGTILFSDGDTVFDSAIFYVNPAQFYFTGTSDGKPMLNRHPIPPGEVKLTIDAPTEIGNLVMWMDASDVSTQTEVAGEIDVWIDKSPTAATLTAQGAGFRAAPVDGAQNGLRVLDFDQSDSYTSDVNIVTSGGAATYFVVLRVDSAAAGNDPILVTGDYRIDSRDSGGGPEWGVFGTAGLSANSAISTTDFEIIEAKFRSGTDVQLFKNKEGDGSGSVAGDGSNATTIIGRNTTAGSLFFSGEIAEIVVYDRELTANESTLVNNYLGAKWGLFGNSTISVTDGTETIVGGVVNVNPSDFYLTQNSDGNPMVNLVGDPIRKRARTFTSSAEWIFDHNLNTTDIVWDTYDEGFESLNLNINRVDVSDPNTAFFYWGTTNRAGRAVVIG